jgi:hypothetical protein
MAFIWFSKIVGTACYKEACACEEEPLYFQALITLHAQLSVQIIQGQLIVGQLEHEIKIVSNVNV